MTNVLTAGEAAVVLRCEVTDANMLALLPLVDTYLRDATGHDWASDSTIRAEAKSAARMLITLWHENPAMIASGMNSLQFGLSAALCQLEAIALRYKVFQGSSGIGYIELPHASEGDTVITLTGIVGVSGDQSSKFETFISTSGMIKQTSSDDLSGNYYRIFLIPLESL